MSAKLKEATDRAATDTVDYEIIFFVIVYCLKRKPFWTIVLL
jgi:hypothetical protein